MRQDTPLVLRVAAGIGSHGTMVAGDSGDCGPVTAKEEVLE